MKNNISKQPLPYQHQTFLYTHDLVHSTVQEQSVEVDYHSNPQTIDYTLETLFIQLTSALDTIDLLTVITAIDALFSVFDEYNTISLATHTDTPISDCLFQFDSCASNSHNLVLWCTADDAHNILINRSTFYQSDQLSIIKNQLTEPPVMYQLRSHANNKVYAPIRADKPHGIVYKRYIPWLQSVLSFEVFDKSKHLSLFHTWMNDPVVDEFWEESGSIAKHEAFIDEKYAPHSYTVCLVACIDDTPFGYFEVYNAKEDRIAPFYDVADFDKGWHVLIGEASCRGKDFVTAWMPSISHYMFLADIRTQRLVIEPRIDNQKMKKSLAKCGYAHYKTFDFPHKTAMLGMLSREQFFMSHALVPLKSS